MQQLIRNGQTYAPRLSIGLIPRILMRVAINVSALLTLRELFSNSAVDL